MRIGIDATFLQKEMSGIGRFLRNILKRLKKFDKKNEYFLFLPGKVPKEYKEMNYKIVNVPKIRFLPTKFYFPLWIFFVLPKLLKKNPVDIFWQPHHFLPPFGLSNKIKYIVTVHDLIPKIDKNYRDWIYRTYFNFLLPQSIKKSEKVVTVSENSKEDIIKFYKVKEKKIEVIYEAAEEKFKPRENEKNLEKVRKKYNLPKEFILYLSEIEKRKNVEGLIKIADILKEKAKIKFVLFGKPGFGSKILLKEIKKRKNMIYKGFADENDIPYIYNLAKIFLFPSFYEGFGLPVLEAMQSGLPAITSNTSSLPEVVGKGGIMHDPNDYKAFADSIKKLLDDKSFYKEMQEKAQSQAKKFSWEKSAQKLVEIFNKI